MKKIFISFLIALSTIGAFAQDKTVKEEKKVEVVQDGKNFSYKKSDKAKSSTDVKTGYTFTDSKGEKYDIYLTKNGKAFIYRTSKKTGNQYKYYLSDEVAKQIRDEK